MNSFGGTWDNKKCFNWEMENNIRLDNQSFINLFNQTALQVSKLVNFETFADIGGGVGAYSLAMKNLNKVVHYYDGNEYHYEYATEHKVANAYYKCDFTKEIIKADLCAMIEVAEHITDKKLIPFLKNVDCKYFHFSSTPHKTDFDAEWGHINIKSKQEWIELFKQCKFELMTEIDVPTQWSLLFKKL